MFAVIVYDIPTNAVGKKRYTKIHNLCKQYGFWVNGSVFEFDMDYSSFLRLIHNIEKVIDKEQDSVRIYEIGKRKENTVTLLGKREYIESSDEVIMF